METGTGTGTYVKYQRKNQGLATELPGRNNKNVKGAGVPNCCFRFFRVNTLRIDDGLVSFTRRGKYLGAEPYISTGDDENEYGKAMVQRDGPFGPSYQDVLQINLPCNADYQYRKRAVPDLAATEHPSEKPPADTGKNTCLACFCYVYRKLPTAGNAILVALTTAMRAANICDFYMTKYQSKTQ